MGVAVVTVKVMFWPLLAYDVMTIKTVCSVPGPIQFAVCGLSFPT